MQAMVLPTSTTMLWQCGRWRRWYGQRKARDKAAMVAEGGRMAIGGRKEEGKREEGMWA